MSMNFSQIWKWEFHELIDIELGLRYLKREAVAKLRNRKDIDLTVAGGTFSMSLSSVLTVSV